ncbi:MAG: hypothetical protein ABL901_03465 [Hyphomicrobiaceae bacterium]
MGHLKAPALIALLLLIAAPVRAAEPCPSDTKASIAMAREALRSQDSSTDRTALLCLIEAVAQLDNRLSDTIAGRIEFEKVTSKAYYPSTKTTTAEAK